MIQRLRHLASLTLVRNILALYGVRLTNQLLPLVLIPYLARVLGPTGWGLVAFAQAFAMYGIIAVEYGFELAGTREVARERDNPERLGQLITGVIATQAMIALVVALVAFAVQTLIPAFRDEPLLLLAGLAFAVIQGMHPLWYFTGRERLPLIAAVDTSGKILATLVIFVLVEAPGDGWIVLACHAAAAALTLVVGYGLVLREVRPGRLSLALVRSTLRLGFSMFLMRMAVLMHTAGNAFLLGLLVPPQFVAFFAAGEKLCRPAAWLLQPVNVALLPRLSSLLGTRPDEADRLAGLAIVLMGATGLAFGGALWLAAPWLVGLIYGDGYEAAIPVMRVMAMIVPLIVLNAALVSQWMVPRGLDRALNVVIIGATAINLGLALLIVPRYQAFGMAWITILVEGLILLGLLIALRRRGLRPLDPALLRRRFARSPSRP